MKKSLIIITLLLTNITLWAQESPETLFDNKLSLSNLGIMVDPGLQWTQVAGENTGFFLFRAGLIYKDKLTLGGFYAQLINDIRPAALDNALPSGAHMDAYQVGGFAEYTIYSSKLVHLTFPVSVGMMELEIDEEGRNFDYEETKTFFVEPGAQVEVNLHRFARLHAGLGYRFMGGEIQDFPGVPEAGNSLTFQIGLKIGLFNYQQIKNK